MKITDITCFPITYNLPKPFSNSAETHSKRSTTLVKVSTDEGITGWGEAYGPAKGVVGIIDSYLKAKYVGQNPFHPEYLWFKTQTHKGISPGAIAGIDVALWDIKAKALNVPLYELFGGLCNPEITPYATGFFFAEDDPESLTKLEEETQVVISKEFKALKVKIGFGLQRDIKRLRRLREMVGDEMEIMTDANQAYDLRSCLQLLPVLEELKVRWLEEPMPWISFDAYRELRNKSSLAIAAGEAEYSYPGFINAITNRSVDVIQPDILACGGLTIARRIALLAESFAIDFQPHVFGGVISLAVAIQLIASLPANQQWMIFPRHTMIEWDSTENPFSRDLLVEPLQMEHGKHVVTSKPGIGVEVNEKAIGAYLMK